MFNWLSRSLDRLIEDRRRYIEANPAHDRALGILGAPMPTRDEYVDELARALRIAPYTIDASADLEVIEITMTYDEVADLMDRLDPETRP